MKIMKILYYENLELYGVMNMYIASCIVYYELYQLGIGGKSPLILLMNIAYVDYK